MALTSAMTWLDVGTFLVWVFLAAVAVIALIIVPMALSR
jgi:hypothetical protein